MKVFVLCHCTLQVCELFLILSKDWQLRVCFETQWNLDLDIWKILKLLNLWSFLEIIFHFSLWEGHNLWGLECYRLNVKCPSWAHEVYTWSTILAGFGKLVGQDIYEGNMAWGLFSGEYFVPITCLNLSLHIMSTIIWTVPAICSCCLAVLLHETEISDHGLKPLKWTYKGNISSSYIVSFRYLVTEMYKLTATEKQTFYPWRVAIANQLLSSLEPHPSKVTRMKRPHLPSDFLIPTTRKREPLKGRVRRQKSVWEGGSLWWT